MDIASSARERGYRVPWGIWLSLGALTFLSGALGLFLLFANAGSRRTLWIDDVAQSAIPLVSAAAWLLYQLVHRETFRLSNPVCRSAVSFCLAAACFGVGQVIWTYYEDVLHTSPSPSWADVAFLSAYPFIFIGTYSLGSRPFSVAARMRILLDATICVTSLIAISWYFVLGPTVLQGGTNHLESAVAMAYPIGDVIAFSSLLLLTMNMATRRYRPAVGVLLAGGICIILSDSVYLYETLHGIYHTGSVSDVGWPLGYGLLVASGFILSHLNDRGDREADTAPPEEAVGPEHGLSGSPNGWPVLIPSVLVLGCWLLVGLAIALDSNRTLLPVLAVASGLLACLVVVRQVLTSRDNNRLLQHLQGAWQETIHRAAEVERAHAALQVSQEKFKSAFDHTANGMALVALDGRWLQVNRALCTMSGYAESELLTLPFNAIVDVHEVDRINTAIEEVKDGLTDSYRGESRCCRKDGAHFWVALTVSAVRDRDRSATSFIWQIQDVTEQKQSEAARRDTERRYRSLVETSVDGILFIDANGTILMANRQAAALHGYDDGAALIGLDWLFLVAAAHYEQAIHHRDLVMKGEVLQALEFPARRKDGSAFPAEMSAARIMGEDGTPVGYMASIRDVTERQMAQERLSHQARHDSLTGLPNRALLRDRIDAAMATYEETGTPAALLLLDLNRFKEVNDTFGHHYGDALLEEMGRRLVETLRDDDTIARLGGDEFAALLPGATASDALQVADKKLSIMDAPFSIEEQDFYVGMSIGIALCPDHGADASLLMRRADIAMYVAKRTANGYIVYSADQDDTNPVRHELMRNLRRAIDHGGLVLHYQPQVDLRSGDTLQVEALIRWEHPEGGFAPPSSFVPLAEETGLIKPLTTWVLNQALRQCAQWKSQGLNVRVAVNLSARSLHEAGLVDSVRQSLRRWGIEASQLCLEITESAIIVDPGRAMHPLAELHALGVRFAIDDFGTGYSSLSYLQRLPIDEIKVDRSFVMDMVTNGDNAVIVRSILDLAHSLGMEVVAEGVESADIGDALRAMGCDLVQGYHVCRPVSATDYVEWYRQQGMESTAHSNIVPLLKSSFG